MKTIKLALVESVLLALTAAAGVFLISAYTHKAFVDVPLAPVIYFSAILYVARLAIMAAVRSENKLRYRKLRGDQSIKVYKEPPKSTLGKKLTWIFIILVILLFLYQCIHHMGMEDFELPINLGFR